MINKQISQLKIILKMADWLTVLKMAGPTSIFSSLGTTLFFTLIVDLPVKWLYNEKCKTVLRYGAV